MAVLVRPKPHPLFAVVRIGVTVFLAVHVFVSAWLVATVQGAYTEGKPSPAEVHSIVAIDKDQTFVDVEVRNSTRLLLYVLARDGGASVPVSTEPADNATEPPDESNEAQQEDKVTSSGEQTSTEPRDWLEWGRNSVKVSLVLLVLSELLMLSSFRWRHHVRTLMFLGAILAFSVLFPASYMLELAGDGDDGEEDTTATNTPGANIETVSFVHTNSSSETRFKWLGVELNAAFSGYDLGLVEPEKRADVAANVPENGSEENESFIAFQSTFNIGLGKNLDSLLVLPVMWFLMPATKRTKARTPSVDEKIKLDADGNQFIEGGENAGS